MILLRVYHWFANDLLYYGSVQPDCGLEETGVVLKSCVTLFRMHSPCYYRGLSVIKSMMGWFCQKLNGKMK
jgi:hypothetical protein